MDVNGFKVIGVGGIGTALAPHLCRYTNFVYKSDDMLDMWFIDGDTWEEKNMSRQDCSMSDMGKNKALTTVEKLCLKFPDLSIEAKETYITEDNIKKLLVNGDVVLMGVDNHKTRKLVSDHCKGLANVVLISGGNEMTDGNVQVYIRHNGVDVTAPIDFAHPEIANPADKAPYELGCAELVASHPQLEFMNLDVASTMLNALHRYLDDPSGMYGEVYVDILANQSVSLERKPLVAVA
jgi:molybdopterin/thiamine biosynthesis adenylyltransferase